MAFAYVYREVLVPTDSAADLKRKAGIFMIGIVHDYSVVFFLKFIATS